MMITLSVCMIVKNEQAALPRCLESLSGLYDELIIVDTGSTDGTKAVAAQYTDKVYDFPWIDDFAAARNASLQHATCEYVYVADADEVIDQENRQKFLLLKQTLSPKVDIVQMKYANQLRHATTYNYDVEYRPKLFRRLRPFYFVEPIHETLFRGVVTENSDVTITHMPEENHAPRDFGVFRRVLARGHRLSPKLHMMYARELFIAGQNQDFLDALAYFEPTLHDEHRSPEEIAQAQCVVAKCALLQKDDALLMKTALKNAVGQPSAEICCILGDYYANSGDHEEAATWYYTAAYGSECELNIHYSGDVPLARLAHCYEKLGLPAQARQARQQADAWQPPDSMDV